MSTNSAQVTQLIERLWAKTQDGSLKWDQLGSSAFQCRLGEFSIALRGPPVRGIGLASEGITLKVTRLDGREVASTSTSTSALAAIALNHASIPQQAVENLKKLYSFISDRSQDIDELLGLLK